MSPALPFQLRGVRSMATTAGSLPGPTGPQVAPMYKAENILQVSKGVSVIGAKGEHFVQDRLVSIQSRQSPQALALICSPLNFLSHDPASSPPAPCCGTRCLSIRNRNADIVIVAESGLLTPSLCTLTMTAYASTAGGRRLLDPGCAAAQAATWLHIV